MLVRNDWSKNEDKMMASFIIRRLVIIGNPVLGFANDKMPNQNTCIQTKEWWVLTTKKSYVFEKNTWNSQVLELDSNNKVAKHYQNHENKKKKRLNNHDQTQQAMNN